MGAMTMRLRNSSEPSRYGVNNALIACPLSIVKPIRAADIARHPFVDDARLPMIKPLATSR
jgi:hypothetical protein